MRKNSIKNTRINGEVQKELSRIISREIKDPRISRTGFKTVQGLYQCAGRQRCSGCHTGRP